MYPFRNLVFEGGGVKGIAYVGALQELEARGIVPAIRRVGGTSAGAINAVLLALGYSYADMARILKSLDFKSFMDGSILRNVTRLLDDYGWYEGEVFRDWIRGLIRDRVGKADATFADLRARGCRELYLMGTNLATGFGVRFSHRHTPDVPVAEATRISMSIPLFFASRRLRGDVHVDGGVMENYPVKLFDQAEYLEHAGHGLDREYYRQANASLRSGESRYVYNQETLGFRLDSKAEIAAFRDGAAPARGRIDDFTDYVLALMRSLLAVQDNYHLHGDDWHRTVYIDTLDVGTTEFGLSAQRKEKLIEQGRQGVRDYFKWYDTASAEDAPENRPAGAKPSRRSARAKSRRRPR